MTMKARLGIITETGSYVKYTACLIIIHVLSALLLKYIIMQWLCYALKYLEINCLGDAFIIVAINMRFIQIASISFWPTSCILYGFLDKTISSLMNWSILYRCLSHVGWLLKLHSVSPSLPLHLAACILLYRSLVLDLLFTCTKIGLPFLSNNLWIRLYHIILQLWSRHNYSAALTLVLSYISRHWFRHYHIFLLYWSQKPQR